ncbi:MAG: energy transducer TonB, partial [Acidimicrobiales bacterium]
MNSLVRFFGGTGLAFLVTTGLFILMMVLIKGDFKPEEKPEQVSFEINPKVEDIKVVARETKIAQVRKVVTPPPPPQIERQQATQPT